jgi:hypothetical protein
MFRPNCRAIFRLISAQVQCTIYNAFNLRDLVLQELVKIILVCYIKDLRLKFMFVYEYNSLPSLHTRTLNLITTVHL